MSKILEKFLETMTDVLKIAISVRTPLMLAGFLSAAFFLILLLILLILRSKIPKLPQNVAGDIIKLIVSVFPKYLFRLTLVAVVLGFVGFVITILVQSLILPADPENREKYPEMVPIPNRGFSIGKYEITNQQYGEFLEDTKHKPLPVFWEDRRFNSANQPVVGVSWNDAMKYCEWLSNKTKETYKLPTKEQWDIAAGSKVTDIEYPWENQITSGLFKMLNIGRKNDWPLDIYRPQHSVYEPDFGIRDMIGNVAEWCSDVQYLKIVRGGSWYVDYEEVKKSEGHRKHPPKTKKDDLGFRVVKLDKVQQPEQGENLE